MFDLSKRARAAARAASIIKFIIIGLLDRQKIFERRRELPVNLSPLHAKKGGGDDEVNRLSPRQRETVQRPAVFAHVRI